MKNPSPVYLHEQVIESLRHQQMCRFKVTGRCMNPLIQKGDWVTIEPFLINQPPRQGDIVLINRRNDFAIHRLLKIMGNEVITRGDWSFSSDPPFNRDNILGKVIIIDKNQWKVLLSHPFWQMINRYFLLSGLLFEKLKSKE